MKTIKHCFIFLLFTFCFFNVQAQIEIPFYNSFDTLTETCPWNDTVSLNSVTGWYAYYTLDDTYNGIVDSNYCINLNIDMTSGHIAIPIAEMDTTKSLFIKAKINDSNKIMIYGNGIYNLFIAWFYYSEFINTLSDCVEDICTGVIFGIQIPDSTYIDSTIIWYEVPYASIALGDYGPTICFASEKFSEQYLREFIFKVTFKNLPDTIENFTITQAPSIHQNETISGSEFFQDLKNSPSHFEDTAYNIYLSDIAYECCWSSGFLANTFVLRHPGDTYPSSTNPGFVEISPTPNPDTTTTINFIIDEDLTLLSQRHTSLIGAFPMIDTTRHTVNMILEGGKLCMTNGIEVIPTEKAKFIYKSGVIHLEGTTACIKLEKGGTLQVAENSILNYSANGIGLLALCNDGKLVLEENASLNIGATVYLMRTENTFENFYITLNASNKLSFTKGSSIWRMNDGAQNMFINVYMNGGILDDSGLSEADKKLIRRIYPAQENKLEDNIFISPNPVNDIAILEIQSEIKTSATISLIDINGKLLKTSLHEIQAGITPVYFDMKNIQKGMYILQVEIDGEIAGKKIIKL